MERRGIEKLGCFYQDDAFGQSVLDLARQRVDKSKIEIVAVGHYKRNSRDIAAAVKAIQKEPVEAVLLIGTYQPCADFIKAIKDAGGDTKLFLMVSFVGSVAVLKELTLSYERNVFISEVTPFPWDETIPIAREYMAAINSTNPSFGSFEGYINAKVFTEIISRIDGDITRESFMDSVNGMGLFDIGGSNVYYDSDNHDGMSEIIVAGIENGKFQRVM